MCSKSLHGKLSLTNRFETDMSMWMARAFKSTNPDRICIGVIRPPSSTRICLHALTTIMVEAEAVMQQILPRKPLLTDSAEEWNPIREAQTLWSTRLPLPSSHSIGDWMKTRSHSTAQFAADIEPSELLSLGLAKAIELCRLRECMS